MQMVFVVIDSEDDEADQPTTVHMPEEEPADDAKPEQDDSADNAEKTIPIFPATRTDGITFCAGLWLSIS